MTQYFYNKVIIITGSGSGMGRTYALAFAKLGAKLGLNDFNLAGLNETIQLIKDKTPNCNIVSQVFDVSDQNQMLTFANLCQQKLGNAFVIINNAGIEGAYMPAWQMDLSSYEHVMKINFFGVVSGTRAFLPQLLSEHTGHIVNVSSIFGLVGTPNHSDYCASKFAVRGFSEALMCELQNSGVQVHLLHPGGIDTNIAKSEGGQAFSKNYLKTSPEEITEYLIKHIERGSTRIIYGNDSLKVWLGSKFVPLKILNKLIWSDMKKVIDQKPYKLIKLKKGIFK